MRHMMDRNGTHLRVLSVSGPGDRLGSDALARRIARDLNEYVASIVDERLGRVGFFVTLTLPDVETVLEEIEYPCDHLHADGVALLANAAGKYLGGPLFVPLLAELNRRGVTVFVHPGTLPAEPVARVPTFALDYLPDASRTAADLILSGALERFPRIGFILAHGGGFVPYAAYRILLTMIAREPVQRKPLAALCQGYSKQKNLEAFRRCYWGIVLTASPAALSSLFDVADPGYGTGWLFAPRRAAKFITRELGHYPMPGWLRDAIDHENALRLFPRIRALVGRQGWYEKRPRRRTCKNR